VGGRLRAADDPRQILERYAIGMLGELGQYPQDPIGSDQLVALCGDTDLVPRNRDRVGYPVHELRTHPLGWLTGPEGVVPTVERTSQADYTSAIMSRWAVLIVTFGHAHLRGMRSVGEGGVARRWSVAAVDRPRRDRRPAGRDVRCTWRSTTPSQNREPAMRSSTSVDRVRFDVALVALPPNVVLLPGPEELAGSADSFLTATSMATRPGSQRGRGYPTRSSPSRMVDPCSNSR
jgi:hypothetical protein